MVGSNAVIGGLRSPELADDGEQVTVLNLRVGRNCNRRDRAGAWRFDGDLHLHGLQNHEDVALGDKGARFNEHLPDIGSELGVYVQGVRLAGTRAADHGPQFVDAGALVRADPHHGGDVNAAACSELLLACAEL